MFIFHFGPNVSLGQMYPWAKCIFGPNVIWAKCIWAKCILGPNVSWAKCIWANCIWANCILGQMYLGQLYPLRLYWAYILLNSQLISMAIGQIK